MKNNPLKPWRKYQIIWEIYFFVVSREIYLSVDIKNQLITILPHIYYFKGEEEIFLEFFFVIKKQNSPMQYFWE